MTPASSPAVPLEEAPGFRLAEAAAWFALSRRAEDVIVLDLRGRSDACDFFVVATGAVDTHVRAVCDAVTDGLAGLGERVHHVEGLSQCRWGLLDFTDVLVHVFQPRAREYYLLERLWSDAPRIAVGDAHFADPAVRARHPWLGAAAADPRPAAPPDER